MKKLILASTSTLPGDTFLNYLLPTLSVFFKKANTITFIPFARPGGISHEHYTRHVSQAFSKIGKKVVGLHEKENTQMALQTAEAIFTGGGNTFLLTKTLYDLGLMRVLKNTILKGVPYLGCSAGSNIAGVNMQTTNDMPIVMPKSFKTMGIIPYNINAHYLDPIPNLKHQGESRETRIKEFHLHHNVAVLGLREGSYLAVSEDQITLEGGLTAKLFRQGMPPEEITTLPK